MKTVPGHKSWRGQKYIVLVRIMMANDYQNVSSLVTEAALKKRKRVDVVKDRL